MPRAVLDVSEIGCGRKRRSIVRIEEVRVVVGNIRRDLDVLKRVELDRQAVRNANGAETPSGRAERFRAARIVMQHERHAVGTAIIVADVDLEGDRESLREVKALLRHGAAGLHRRVRRNREAVVVEVVGGIARRFQLNSHVERQQARLIEGDFGFNLDRRGDGDGAVCVDGEQHPITGGQDVRIVRQLDMQDPVRSDGERQLDALRRNIDGMRDGAELHQSQGYDRRVAGDRDLEVVADIKHVGRFNDHGTLGGDAPFVEQIVGRVYFTVEVRQRSGRATAERHHRAVGQQERARMVEARHSGVSLVGPKAGVGVPDSELSSRRRRAHWRLRCRR